MSNLQEKLNQNDKSSEKIDVIIVGAGFSGLYMLYRVRELGMTVRIIEAAAGVGGTWYWNRYPGARCDIESLQYSYSFSDKLREEWHWSERYASQPEILNYLNYVADKFDLRKDIQFQTRVTTANFHETLARWNIQTDNNEQISAKFCIMATGCLSVPKKIDLKGMDTFKGNIYYTSQWPHTSIDFTGQRVAVIGTGSSGIQSIPIIAQQADHVYVFQQTPSFSIPAHNGPLDTKVEQSWKINYDEHRRKVLGSSFGVEVNDMISDKPATTATSEEQQEVYETQWQIGGLTFIFSFNDLLFNKEANTTAADFVSSKIRAIVKDPMTAESLTSQDYPIGCKRVCIDTNYYDTYNRNNVTLINLRKENIEEITTIGIKTKNNIYQVDNIIFATGFDAMTGALLNINIQGRSGNKLKEKWIKGPCTYLGIMTADFPNLFMITGPGSPSVLTNMIVSIEQHVEWITECLDYLRKHHYDSIEATNEAEDAWVNQVNAIANATLFPTANSWYMGANIPGKPRVCMVYVGGFVAYHKICQDIVANGYEGFQLMKNN
ncbi:unnamed protein product [Adineta steineri]|uniref:Cyclohexanone monooxygenase n=1 Tax=Adineta steineri TaxID=433720 RepID=A0A815IA01_9BILA|nr:unnamed protein product [Adineta steineri]CAF1360958.1 unnamed protein product [Adineta steineri]